MIDSTLALYFYTVAEHQSISEAAVILKVNPGTVSRKIDELEQKTGLRLFDRTSRSLQLTEPGEAYLHYVRKAVHMLELGNQTIERYSSDVSGNLRIVSPVMLGKHFVAEIVARFSALYPRLQISLALDSKAFSLRESSFDVGICIGMPLENRAVVSKLSDLTLGYVATPQFLKAHGVPTNIHALAKLPIIAVAFEKALGDPIVLQNELGERLYLRPALLSNDYEAASLATMLGGHVGRLVLGYCTEEIARGELRIVMPELLETIAVYSVVPARKGNPLKVQLFNDFLKEQLIPQLLAYEKSIQIQAPAHAKPFLE